jgi:hypothetical protein
VTSNPGVLIRRGAIFVHRWLGVTLCIVFLLWFPSGIALMYWDFPGVTPGDRLERSPVLDRFAVKLSPAEALAKLQMSGSPTHVRLNMFDGRPVYRFGVGREEAVVYADTGEEQVSVSRSMMDRIAAAWTRQPADAARVESMRDVDQWTVQGQFRNARPLWKYSWPDGEEVYISERSGEVVQYTTRASRLGAYVGAIPHWLYFTPLRKHGPEWSSVVIWSSGIGTLAALLGIVIGVWTYSPARRYRRDGVPTSIPYRGQKRWHMILGLMFGLGAATWAFSGMLSMDPFPRPTGGPVGGRDVPDAIQRALRNGPQLASFASKSPHQALAQLAGLPVKELELTTAADEPVYLATAAHGQTRIVPINGAPRAGLEHDRLIDAIENAAQPVRLAEIRVLDQYDRYYLDRRHQRPLPVILARLDDPGHTRLYIDPDTASVVGTYNSRNWVNRWVYHGLHSLDFPWLYNYRPLWDVVVITFMVGGTALCVTSLILAWRVVGRKLEGVGGRPSQEGLPDDSLAVQVD